MLQGLLMGPSSPVGCHHVVDWPVCTSFEYQLDAVCRHGLGKSSFLKHTKMHIGVLCGSPCLTLQQAFGNYKEQGNDQAKFYTTFLYFFLLKTLIYQALRPPPNNAVALHMLHSFLFNKPGADKYREAFEGRRAVCTVGEYGKKERTFHM